MKRLNRSELGALPPAELQNYYRELRLANDKKQGALQAAEQNINNELSVYNGDKNALYAPYSVGNVSDLNKLMWGFLFQTELAELSGETTVDTKINITLEAAFVITHISGALFEKVIDDEFGKKIFQFRGNVLNGDILRIAHTNVVIGTDFAMGATLALTLANAVTYLNATAPINTLFDFTNTDSTLIATSKISGFGTENLLGAIEYISAGGLTSAPLLLTRSAKGTAGDIKNIDLDVAKNNIGDLNFSVNASSSGRIFSESPIRFGHLGSGKRPLILDNPYMLMPNENLSVIFSNNSLKTYIPSVCFWGYRLRVEDAQNILQMSSQA